MLTGLSQIGDNLNIRGAIQVDYVPTDWIDRSQYSEMPDANYNVTVPLKSGKTWLQLFVLVGERAWSETSQDSPQGNTYDLAINAMLPRQDTAIARELYLTAKYRYMVRLTDMNGEQWTMGTLQSPLSFFSDFNSRQNIYQIRFSGKALRKATGINYSPLPPPGSIITITPPSGSGMPYYEVMETVTGISGSSYHFTTTLPMHLTWFVLRNNTVHFPTILTGGYLEFTPSVEVWEVLDLVFLKQN